MNGLVQVGLTATVATVMTGKLAVGPGESTLGDEFSDACGRSAADHTGIGSCGQRACASMSCVAHLPQGLWAVRSYRNPVASPESGNY
ncbi:MAG: hypothetical protein DWQ45_04280 [Planctomycetota bacterium]|nr:MAG: hypothetical protein DWQ45_04280 [Planctomycetota bacterium]